MFVHTKASFLWLLKNWIESMDNSQTSGPLLKILPKIFSDSTASSILVQAENKITPTRLTGLKKSPVQLSRTSRFSFWASNFSFPLAKCPQGKDQASCLPTESLKELLVPRASRYLSQGQAAIQGFGHLQGCH